MSSDTSGSHGWRRSAACRSADPDLFFPAASGRRVVEQVERAKALCAACVVRRQCLQYALGANEEYGVWGAMTEDERRRAAGRARVWARLARPDEPGPHPVGPALGGAAVKVPGGEESP